MTEAVERLLTQHLDTWTAAVETKSAAGRGSSKKLKLVGIQKLRELILELAVRGQLVPQDENDEPASVLLERIAIEKKQLLVEKKISKQSQFNEIEESEFPFSLPNGWCFVRLGEVTNRIGSGSTPRGGKNAYLDSGIPFLRSQNVLNDGLKLSDVAFISAETHEKMKNTKVFPRDILLNITGGSLGRCTLIPDDFKEANVSQHVSILRPTNSETRSYIHLCILSPYTQRMIWGRQVGMAREGLSKKVLEQFEIPLPPLLEQKRIVAKVDELMALCDSLEQEQEICIAAHGLLVESLLVALTNAASQGEFKQAWTGVAEHFDTLFTTEQSVEQLKQTILQLAVMGKLVEQDPTDEPASVLLERVAAEKNRLIEEKVIKKQKVLPEISEEEKVFELPEGWAWCRLGDLALDSSAGWSPKCLPTPREAKKWGVLKVSAVTWGDYQPEENKELPSELEPRENCEVKDGDFLISRANTAELVARAVVVPDGSPTKLMMSDKIIRFKFADEISTEFINLVNNSNVSRNYYLTVAGGTSSSMKNVSREQVRNLVVSLPPLQEQIKIVERVEQLRMMFEGLTVQVAKSKVSQVLLANVLAGAVLK